MHRRTFQLRARVGKPTLYKFTKPVNENGRFTGIGIQFCSLFIPTSSSRPLPIQRPHKPGHAGDAGDHGAGKGDV